jgi:hypothetical protein
MSTAKKKADLLELLTEIGDVAAEVGVAALEHDLDEGLLDELLARAKVSMVRLRRLRTLLPAEDGPETACPSAYAP